MKAIAYDTRRYQSVRAKSTIHCSECLEIIPRGTVHVLDRYTKSSSCRHRYCPDCSLSLDLDAEIPFRQPLGGASAKVEADPCLFCLTPLVAGETDCCEWSRGWLLSTNVKEDGAYWFSQAWGCSRQEAKAFLTGGMFVSIREWLAQRERVA